MEMFASHNHTNIQPHEKLPVVFDIDEEDEDRVEADRMKRKLNDINIVRNHSNLSNNIDMTSDAVTDAHATTNGTEMTPKFSAAYKETSEVGPGKTSTPNSNSHAKTKHYIKRSEEGQAPFRNHPYIRGEERGFPRISSTSDATELGAALSGSLHQPCLATECMPSHSHTEESCPHVNISRKSSGNSAPSSVESLDNLSIESSLPDFQILKSAMKKSCEEQRRGKRRLSLFNHVMRRVSIHRRESTPTGRIATFLFGVEDSTEPKERDSDDIDKEKLEYKDLEENGGHTHTNHHEKKASHGSQLRESLFLILSGLYGIIVVILGAVIPITEIFMADSLDRAFGAFYVYLYVVSILFLGYVYAYLLRRNRLKTEFLTRTLSRSLSWTRAWGRTFAKTSVDSYTKGRLRKRMISLDVSNHHTGTFYLRLGVLGFGIGSMIHSGLNFGTYFSSSGTKCNEPLQAIKPMIHLMFTFFQLYFIFMNSKMCIHRYKKLARFGLMHMCATNICVWFRAIVVETLHVIHSASQHGSGSHHGGGSKSGGGTHHGGGTLLGSTKLQEKLGITKDTGSNFHQETTYLVINTSVVLGRRLHSEHSSSDNESDLGVADLDDICQWSDMMGKAVEAAGPYLYPCTIEYSLMCAGILYIMWKNVGKRPRRPRGSELGDEEDDQRVHRMSVDCTGSSRGLFLGIFIMVGTIISIIAFYMLISKEESKLSGIILTHLSETAIYTVTLIALFLAAYRMKTLTFHNQHEADLEDILILISYTGLLAFIIFSLVASMLSKPDTRSGMTILSNIVMLIQSTVQTIFMLAGDRMSASTELQERKKPGREFITFLLVSNFAMWAINTFETQTPQHNPIQVEFYGVEAWAIFTHISVPLGIYYRFHSTVCFSNIWKNAWKKRKH
ncbi:hypothetical protein BsWGS_24333 [Bradybaena similaris]